jgi:hypothetical protein
MTREEAERYRDEHALDLAHLADKVSVSRKRAEMMGQAEQQADEEQPPEDPAELRLPR